MGLAARLLLIYVATIGLAGWLWPEPLVLTSCYVALSAVVLGMWHSKRDLVFYFVPLVLGPLAEVIAVSLGAWKYSEASWLIPPWLPFSWGIAVLFIYRIAVAVAPREGG